MTTLTRYVLREYLKIFGMILFLLTTISLLIHFLEKIKKFSERAVSVQPILRYFLYKLPGMLFDVMPFVILLSTLVTLGLLARNNEIIAFRSAGISLFRLTLPLTGAAFCLSLLLFFLNGSLLPHMQKEARVVRETLVEGKRVGGHLVQDAVWLRDSRNLLLRAQIVEPAQNRMTGVRLFYLGEDAALLSEIEAKEIVYTQGAWMLSTGLERRFLPDGTVRVIPLQHRRVALHTPPEALREIEVVPDEMSDQRLSDYVVRLSEAGLPVERYRVGLYAKQAAPFACFIMALLGIPFVLQKEGMARGIVLGLILALVYWLFSAFSIALGRATILPAWIAAWAANLTFLAIGCGLFLRAESCGRQ
jgi:lipopolysaccharide export system permease protein